MVATCVAHGINPRAYLHRVVRLLVDGWPQSRFAEVLPDRIATLYPELAVKANQVLPSATCMSAFAVPA